MRGRRWNRARRIMSTYRASCRSREALAGYLGEIGISGYKAGEVLVSAGVQEARFLTIQMMAGLGGEIALPAVVHPGVRKAAGIRPLKLTTLPAPRGRGYLPSVADIAAALQAGARLPDLESPSRLTGAIYASQEVRDIAALLAGSDARVIWDQGLAPWVAGRQYVSLGSVADLADRVLLIGEAWPGTGLESLMVGYVAAHEEWLEPIRSQKQIISICTSTPSQYAALKSPGVYRALHEAQLGLLCALRERAVTVARQLAADVLDGSAANILALRAGGRRRCQAAPGRGWIRRGRRRGVRSARRPPLRGHARQCGGPRAVPPRLTTEPPRGAIRRKHTHG